MKTTRFLEEATLMRILTWQERTTFGNGKTPLKMMNGNEKGVGHVKIRSLKSGDTKTVYNRTTSCWLETKNGKRKRICLLVQSEDERRKKGRKRKSGENNLNKFLEEKRAFLVLE
ncbi:hypothetical protein RUM43_009888 [Polyplax serrata]|uniref:Uncharacterized protein n=1 Tax=Polyplax serrata TaxID=468196 RepID=A0AAN8P7Y1_POLSC